MMLLRHMHNCWARLLNTKQLRSSDSSSAFELQLRTSQAVHKILSIFSFFLNLFKFTTSGLVSVPFSSCSSSPPYLSTVAMEERVKRESRKLIEKMFTERDKNKIGAIPTTGLAEILSDLVPVYDEEELLEMTNKVKKDCKYQVINPQTRKMEVKKEKDMVDFPSLLAICVHFLTKHERKASRAFEFSGRSTIRLDSFDGGFAPVAARGPASPIKGPPKRMY